MYNVLTVNCQLTLEVVVDTTPPASLIPKMSPGIRSSEMERGAKWDPLVVAVTVSSASKVYFWAGMSLQAVATVFGSTCPVVLLIHSPWARLYKAVAPQDTPGGGCLAQSAVAEIHPPVIAQYWGVAPSHTGRNTCCYKKFKLLFS